jgi:hypothetical protein
VRDRPLHVPIWWRFCRQQRRRRCSVRLVAALKSQVHSDEIATHGLNATLSGKDKKIARLEA